MLEAEVSETVILRWLDTGGRRPASVSSQELIDLKRAGASEALMEKLLERAGEPAPAPAPAAPSPARTNDPSGAVPLRVHLQYQPLYEEDEEPWDLFVYLDGNLLARVEGPVVSAFARPLIFDGSLPPGSRVVRLVQERHRLRTGGWRHEARVAPESFSFTLQPGEPARLEIQVRQVKLALRQPPAPLSFRLVQGERTVAESGQVGKAPETWPPLCEEIEANPEPGQRPALPIRRELERCVRWAGLWPGMAGIPTREAVRAELERYRFRPVPTNLAGQ